MAKSARNGASGRGQHKLHRVIVYLLHFANQIRQPHAFKVFIAAARHFMVRVLLVFLPVKREHDIIGVQLARGF
ncbi:Uncharacterised protein [Salmonella enterica subsp. enterica serovar Typhi]|nr:Uncharacterised protein [Salmonella enterica subsp. enterica serovar Typhi]